MAKMSSACCCTRRGSGLPHPSSSSRLEGHFLAMRIMTYTDMTYPHDSSSARAMLSLQDKNRKTITVTMRSTTKEKNNTATIDTYTQPTIHRYTQFVRPGDQPVTTPTGGNNPQRRNSTKLSSRQFGEGKRADQQVPPALHHYLLLSPLRSSLSHLVSSISHVMIFNIRGLKAPVAPLYSGLLLCLTGFLRCWRYFGTIFGVRTT